MSKTTKEELSAIGQIDEILSSFDIWAQERMIAYLADLKEQRNVWGEEKKGKKDADD